MLDVNSEGLDQLATTAFNSALLQIYWTLQKHSDSNILKILQPK